MVATTSVGEINLLHAQICAALADPRRILLLYTLAEGPRCVGDLAEQLGITQPAVSRHLKLLRDHGLVQATRHGSNVEYAITDERLIDVLDLLRAILRDRLTHQATLADAEPVPEAALAAHR